MTRHVDDREIRQYLLGRAGEQDETSLEAAYFGDPALLERIEAVADDLADEYASGRMPQADRADFERRRLASAEGRQEIAFARALRAANTREPGDAGFERARAWRAWLGWAAAAVLVVAGGYLAWQQRPTADRTTSDAPSVATVPSDTTPTTPTPPAPEPTTPAAPERPAIRVATLLLTGDLARSEGQPPTLVAAPDVTHVDLIIPLSDAPRADARARVESVEGKQIWTGPIERPDGPGSRPRARVLAASLPPGDYILSLDDGAAYYFRVRNQ